MKFSKSLWEIFDLLNSEAREKKKYWDSFSEADLKFSSLC